MKLNDMTSSHKVLSLSVHYSEPMCTDYWRRYMPILAMLLLAAPTLTLLTCRAEQLSVAVDGREGDFNGMSHSGTELAIRNRGPDCMLGALPVVQLRDVSKRNLPAKRRAPLGLHPDPAMVPIRLAAGHRAVTEIRWVSGPVFPRSRSLRVAKVSVRIGATVISAPLKATLYGAVRQPVTFDQTPLHSVEGMAAG